MTLQLLHSELPYIWGKFDFLFYQCTIYTIIRCKYFDNWRVYRRVSCSMPEILPSWCHITNWGRSIWPPTLLSPYPPPPHPIFLYTYVLSLFFTLSFFITIGTNVLLLSFIRSKGGPTRFKGFYEWKDNKSTTSKDYVFTHCGIHNLIEKLLSYTRQ